MAELIGRLGGAAVAAGGRGHARIAGGDGTNGAGDKGDGRGPGDAEAQKQEHDDDKYRQDRVFLFQKGHGPFVDLTLELLHQLVSVRLLFYVAIKQKGHQQPEQGQKWRCYG